ncbi:LuxR C-terminal-related transcriptional regulator [Nocardia sp. NPDC046763]|uniref:LuxR C-terminal-related transcriptional regulator n=1 Tax=Nocardia sp. NPDC046763 TaxID=3155256 RepID=UPI0033DE372A
MTDLQSLRNAPAADHRNPILIGRDSQLAELRRLVFDQRIRLLTVTGGAGVGKSRLAATALRNGETPIIAVDLAETSDLTQAWRAILDAIGRTPEPSAAAPGPDVVAAGIGTEPMILLADDCDHLAGDLADGLSLLLARCPNLAVVATSRRALDLYQEVLYLVPPLRTTAVPDRHGLSPAAQLLSNSIETRFRGAAAAADRSVLEEIATELDGVPVALELAATAIGRFGAERTLRRIRSGQPLPNSPFVDIPVRHRSIRSCVEWGMTDLDDVAVILLLHVAASDVLTDLEEVLLLSGEQRDIVAEKLVELVNRSLLDHAVADNGHYTYAISGFTRSFCRQLLHADPERAARVSSRRAGGLRRLANEITRLLSEPGRRPAALRLIDRWLPDLIATVHYLIDHSAYRDAIQLLSDLEDVWIERAMLADTESIVAALLLAADSDTRDPTVAAACRELLGRWAFRSGRYHDAVRLLAAVVGTTDPALAYRTARYLAHAYHEIGKTAQARDLLDGFPLAAATPGEQAVGELMEALIDLGDGPVDDDETWLALRDRAAELPRRRDRLAVLNALGRTLLRARAPHRALEVFHLVLRTPEPVMNLLELVTALEGCARAYRAAGTEYSEQIHRLSAAAHWIRVTYSFSQLTEHSPGLPVEGFESSKESEDPAVSAIGTVLDIDEAIAYALSTPLLSSADLGSPLLSRLTKRQLEIARLVAEGMTNRMIASRLGIAEWTVVNHLRQVMTKLDCPSRLHVALVIERGTQQTA